MCSKLRTSQRFLSARAWGFHAVALLVCVLCFGLRFHKYDTSPPHNWTADEYAFAWSGMSLWQQGVPESWSWFGAYGEAPVETWKGNPYRIVRPWFDHPPVFSLLVGAAALSGGAAEYFDVQLSNVRFVMLVIATVTCFLVMELTRKLTSVGTAVLAGLLYATNPAGVFLSRIVISESFIALLFVCAALLFVSLPEKKSLLLNAGLAVLAFLCKVTGGALALALAAQYLLQEHRRAAACMVATLALAVALWFAYGALYDFPLFLRILFAQAGRFGSVSLQPLLVQGGMPFWEPLIVAACVGMAFARGKKLQFLHTSVITYVLLLLVTGAFGHYYPWYQLVVWPFLVIILAHALWGHRRETHAAYTLLTLLLLGWSVDALRESLLPNVGIGAGKYALIILLCACADALFARESTLRSWQVGLRVFVISSFVCAGAVFSWQTI